MEDGWIEWAGGECPVEPDVLVEYRLRNDDECKPEPAKYIDWQHDGVWNDIIAYRVVSS